MHIARGPAWQVRQAAQKRLLELLTRKIDSWNYYFTEHGLPRLFCTLFCLIDRELEFSQSGIVYDDLSRSDRSDERLASRLLSELLIEVHGFVQSKEERGLILANLLSWIASEITAPYHARYSAKELELLRKVYEVERSTDEVPFT
jgi:hypothetical protein